MSQSKIISIGEAMVELSQANDPGLWRLGVAGDTLNTAWYLRKILPENWQVSYFTKIGTGEFSQRMLDFFETEEIDTAHIGRDPRREVGLYSISLNNGERSFSYWRDNSAAKRLADDPAALKQALSGASLAYFSGITLAILDDSGRETLIATLKEAQKSGARIVFDSNLRPRLWPDTATMCAQIETAAAISDLILPSFDDESQYFGDRDSKATIERYLDRGAGQVVVKAGGAAIQYGGREGSGMISDLKLETPVDTTSAGDSFNAGYLAATLSGRNIETAIRAGHALSSQVILHRGALVEQAVAAVHI